MTEKNALVVFMKAPVPGLCKTRLTPPLSAEQAAALYQAFCADVLASTQSAGADIWIAYDPHEPHPTPDWAGDSPFFIQRGEGLGERLVHAFETLFAKGYHRVVGIGTDAPAVPARRFEEAFRALEACDAVYGPADDGGYYLVGLRHLNRALFEDIPWSTENVLSATRRALAREGLSAAFLQGHYDVDSAGDLRRLVAEKDLARLCPQTARRLAELKIV